MRRLLPLLMLAAFAVGCSGDGDDTSSRESGASSTPSKSSTPVPTGPACDAVWKAGDTLDEDYEVCVDDGAAGVQDVFECTEGAPLIVFDNELFGRPGEEIQEAKESPVQDTDVFAKAYTACTGD